jgi:hypothetical protein
MTLQLILDNLANAPVLFFMLGMAAVWLKSDLDVPQPVAKLLSLYLLMSIGFRGGYELSTSEHSKVVLEALLLCGAMAVAVPLWSFAVLRWKLDATNAAAIAATYGSISAVTFITASNFLDQQNIHHGGHMVAAMALMESPAIVIGILLARRFADNPDPGGEEFHWGHVLREAFLNSAVLLLLGSLLIGLLTGERGWKGVKPFMDQPFKGVLCLFLLDMGLVAARRMNDLRKSGAFLVGFALLAPPVHAVIGILLAHALGLEKGDALLLAVLCGSASYIAVPAAMRLSLPKANPGLYVPMALAVTFPLNVTLGIPAYLAAISWLGG